MIAEINRARRHDNSKRSSRGLTFIEESFRRESRELSGAKKKRRNLGGLFPPGMEKSIDSAKGVPRGVCASLRSSCLVKT